MTVRSLKGELVGFAAGSSMGCKRKRSQEWLWCPGLCILSAVNGSTPLEQVVMVRQELCLGQAESDVCERSNGRWPPGRWV